MARSSGVALMALLLSAGHPQEPGELSGAVLAPPPVVVDTLDDGEEVAGVLARNGMAPDEADRLAALIRGVESPQPGTELRLVRGTTAAIEGFSFPRDRRRLVRGRKAEHGWTVDLVPAPVRRDTLLLSGQLGPASYYATRRKRRSPNIDPRYLVTLLARRLAVEPHLRSGDAYYAVVERDRWADGSLRDARVLAARYHGLGGTVTAVRREEPGGRAAYVDPNGRRLDAPYTAPVGAGRVTSRFSEGRYHPILRRRIPHRGVDYGGWYGTPVHAAAPGRVTYRGWFGGHGRMIEITHPDGRRTRYSHLARYRPGLRAGSRVAQGEIIGEVGDTGLANGPHLHFALIEDGEYVDPLVPRFLVPARTAGAAAASAPSFGRELGALRTLLYSAEADNPPGSWSLVRVGAGERRDVS